MLRYVIVKVQYKGETLEQMDERERIMEEHNRRLDELCWRNSLPMRSMRTWAEKRGLISGSWFPENKSLCNPF